MFLEKVSIITPSYNSLELLKNCIASVQTQNWDFEHIVVDDGSTDGTGDWLKTNEERYEGLKVVLLTENQGPVVARNRAIDCAVGRFIAFLDVDDEWHPNKLEIQIRFMLENKAGLCYSDYRFMSEDNCLIGRRIKGFNKIGFHLHHMTRFLGCLTIIVDRQIVGNFSIPPIHPATRAEDFVAWSQIIKQHNFALRCPFDLARYRIMKKSRSTPITGYESVWRIYRVVENISLPLSIFYFGCYGIFVVFKRWFYKPRFVRAEIDYWAIRSPNSFFDN